MTKPITRREIMGGALATGVSLLGVTHATSARTYNGAMPESSAIPDNPKAVEDGGYIFFSNEEAAFVAAVAARLIPADVLGPGALEAGCVVFIDRQLAGSYGRADRWYMQGPWPEGDDQQGMQGRMTPAESYRAGIRAVNAHCREHFTNKTINELAIVDQDALLTALEKGEIELNNIKAKKFFALLLQNTIEGFFADPLYGGNRDMLGWKLIGFPGARYDHRDDVGKHGEPYNLPPVGILGRKAWG